jgi:hypothetical protein
LKASAGPKPAAYLSRLPDMVPGSDCGC